jgi:hypothetical protein
LCFDDLAAGHRTHGWATRAAGWSAATLCHGTFETCQRAAKMSACRGRPEVTGGFVREAECQTSTGGVLQIRIVETLLGRLSQD